MVAAALLWGLWPTDRDPPVLGARLGVAPTSWTLVRASDAQLERDLDAVAATGARWVRFDFDWSLAEPVAGRHRWEPLDRLVRAARSRGLRVLGTIAYTPAWARPPGTSDKVPPSDLGDYVDFVRAAVTRYAPRGVHAWEIWNEPNIVQFWRPRPEPARYAELLRRSYGAIKALDPGATVVSAGLAPAGDSPDGRHVRPRTFLRQLYAAGAKGSFDALGMHPYAYPYGIHAAGEWNQWYTLPETRQVLVDHGDGHKQIWATEYGAPTGRHRTAVDEPTQRRFVTEAIDSWTQWSWAGPLFWYGLRDSGPDPHDREQNFGLLRHDGSAKPAYDALRDAAGRLDVGPLAASRTTAKPNTIRTQGSRSAFRS